MLQTEIDQLLARRPCQNCCALFAPHELKKCSGCKTTKYCSVACSKESWKSGHKALCKSIKDSQDMLEEIALDQPYEVMLKNQFQSYGDRISPMIAGAAAQAFALRARGYPPIATPGPSISPATHVLLFIFEFDIRERDILKQFNFIGAQSVPLGDMCKRTHGAMNQQLPQFVKGSFTRQWLDNAIGMKQLPADNPRIPIALEAHFARSCWGATGGPSFTAHHTGLSITLDLPPAMSFPTPDPEKWIFDFGDHLSEMKEVGWKEKQEIRSARAKQEFKKGLLQASPGFPEEQFEEVWRHRQDHQRFYGMD